MDHYIISPRPISSGVSCRVFRGHIKSTQEPVEFKVFSTDNSIDMIKNEISINKRLSSHKEYAKHFPRFIDSFVFESQTYLVFECMDTDLFNTIKSNMGRLYYSQKFAFAFQIVASLALLHHEDMVHGDLKPKNILVNINGRVKLVLSHSTSSVSQNHMTPAGGQYRAPELCISGLRLGKDRRSIDMWSLGCVLAEIILERPLIRGRSSLLQLEKIFQLVGAPEADYADNVQVLSERYKINEFISNSRFLRKFEAHFEHIDFAWYSLISRLLQLDPDRRPSAIQVLESPLFCGVRDSCFCEAEEDTLPPHLSCSAGADHLP
jgi:serine/threonine protein kinase